MPVSEATFKRVALEDPKGAWELVRGDLRRKNGMTFEHAGVIDFLDWRLKAQLDHETYAVRTDIIRLRVQGGDYYIPDVCVLPRALVRRGLQATPRELEVYDDPALLVVEVWSPSTGRRDREEKLAAYRERGDEEIWLIHPRRKTLTSWRRRADRTYEQSLYRTGRIEPVALPGAVIDLDALFNAA